MGSGKRARDDSAMAEFSYYGGACMKVGQVMMNVRMWGCCGIPLLIFVLLCMFIEREEQLTTTYFEYGGVIAAIMVGAIQNLRTKLAEYNVLFAKSCPLTKQYIEEHLGEQEGASLRLTLLIILGLLTTVVMIIGVIVEKMCPSITSLVFNLSCSLSISCIANYLYVQFDYMKIESKNLKLVFEERLVEREKRTKSDLIEKIKGKKGDKYPEQWKI